MPVFSMPGPTKTWKAWNNRDGLHQVPFTTELDDYIAANPAEALTIDFYFVSIPFDSFDIAASYKTIIDGLHSHFANAGQDSPYVIGHLRNELYGFAYNSQAIALGAPTWAGREPTVAMYSRGVLEGLHGWPSWSDFADAMASNSSGGGYSVIPGDDDAYNPQNISVILDDQEIGYTTNIMDLSVAGWLENHHSYLADACPFYCGLEGAQEKIMARIEHKEQWYDRGLRISYLPGDPTTYYDHQTDALTATASSVASAAAWVRSDWRGLGEEDAWDTDGLFDYPDVSWTDWYEAQRRYADLAGTYENPLWYDFPYNAPWHRNRLSWTQDPDWSGDAYDFGQDDDSAYNLAVRSAMALARGEELRDACRNLPRRSVILIPAASTIIGYNDAEVIDLFQSEDWTGQGKFLIERNGTTYTVLQEANLKGRASVSFSRANSATISATATNAAAVSFLPA